MDWHDALLGRCSLTWVFISTTRTARGVSRTWGSLLALGGLIGLPDAR